MGRLGGAGAGKWGDWEGLGRGSRDKARPCSGATSFGHNLLQSPSSPSRLSFPKPFSPTCPKHRTECFPKTLSDLPHVRKARLEEEGSFGVAFLLRPPLLLPRPQPGVPLRPHRFEGEVLPIPSQATLIVFPTPSSPLSLPVEWM